MDMGGDRGDLEISYFFHPTAGAVARVHGCLHANLVRQELNTLLTACGMQLSAQIKCGVHPNRNC